VVCTTGLAWAWTGRRLSGDAPHTMQRNHTDADVYAFCGVEEPVDDPGAGGGDSASW
jgi:hypothetical protein